MAQHNDAQTDAAERYLDAEAAKSYVSAFKRRQPLTFSPNRQYVLAVVSPLQKQDSYETVLAGDSSSRASSPFHEDDRSSRASFPSPAFNMREIHYYYRPIHWPSPAVTSTSTMTAFEPFSFDERDAARKTEREQRLQEMRQMQERQWRSTFKAHPIRRYKPLVQLCQQSMTHYSQKSK